MTHLFIKLTEQNDGTCDLHAYYVPADPTDPVMVRTYDSLTDAKDQAEWMQKQSEDAGCVVSVLFSAPVKLETSDGLLYFPFPNGWDEPRTLLMCVYPAGDCDVPTWPMTEPDHNEWLARALFDCFESCDGAGRFRPVMLPDGSMFDPSIYLR